MNLFEKVLYFFQGEMERPVPFGWFHLLWLFLMILSIVILCLNKNRSEHKLNKILLTYGLIAFILELIKQLIWSFNYDSVNNIVIWDYQWYASAFQLCTTPIYVSLIIPFIKNEKVKNALYSYLAYFTILGSLSVIFLPESCFVRTIEVNIHTMFLHYGSFIISMYLMISKKVSIKIKNVFEGFKVFLIFMSIALLLDVIIYNSGILNGETFNMFFISPYFISTLPVYDVVQKSIPYIFYLLFYIITILIGGLIIYGIRIGIKKIFKIK